MKIKSESQTDRPEIILEHLALDALKKRLTDSRGEDTSHRASLRFSTLNRTILM